MITHFHIENFKSLADFDLPPKGQELAGFTCLIGMNGAGKTTLLQAFDLTASLMVGRVEEWFRWRDWGPDDVRTRLHGPARNDIRVVVGARLANGIEVAWDATLSLDMMRCLREAITVGGTDVLRLQEDGSLWVANDDLDGKTFDSVPFEFGGSVLSTLRLDSYHYALREMKEMLLGLHSLELLSPQQIRRSSRESEDIGPGGEMLAGFISLLTDEQRADLKQKLQKIYPQVKDLQIQHKQYGWKGLLVTEQSMAGHPVTEAHINDGFLRVLAMLSQAYTKHRILLLDEIENGINPAVAEELMDFLVSLTSDDRQVIVTTHSPVILNYLDDEVAKAGIILLYKSPDGRTHSRRYFDIQENAKKLRALGPGEVFLDTSIEALVDRIVKEEAQPLTAA